MGIVLIRELKTVLKERNKEMGDVHDASYYAKSMAGGIFACGLTHAFICPLDIVKCRKQANPEMYKSIADGFKVINATEGLKGFTLGWFPTLVGYGAQGFCKFGFYEIFKDVYKFAVGKENAAKYQTVGFAVSSFEAAKVRMQTSDKGTFPTTFREAWPKIMQAEGWSGFYKGIAPLWCRQIPYTIVKFVAFEKTVRYLYANVFTAPRESYSKNFQLMVTFMAGLWAGLGARIFMVGTLTGLQWWIYDTFKVAMGLQ